MAKTTPKPPDPQCPICKGKGWYLAPYDSMDFEPRMDYLPCPKCIELEPIPWHLVLLIFAVLALLGGLLAWGLP